MADLTVLKEAGMDIDGLPAEQKGALDTLDQSEVDALAAIHRKLNGDAEVSGYAMTLRSDGGIVW